MSVSSEYQSDQTVFGSHSVKGLLVLFVASLGAIVFFIDGLDALRAAWELPEYSHGPLIPILSAFLFLRQLKEFPVEPGPKQDRWIGFCVLIFAVMLGTLGKLSNISDIVAYATIVWVGGILLVSFGWKTGKNFWPPVLHLVYMLPLPGVVYYKLSTVLQLISSELGVWFLELLNVPVFLGGNIIDLGVTKLQVAEACSGLRYLFPILSFSYIFAVLYKGPTWHKAILLISAAPITVVMNSVRIAIAGYIVNYYGLDWVEGFTHFFEGWVIFVACIAILFFLAWVLLKFQKTQMSLVDALDLDTDGLWDQAKRVQFVFPSPALFASALLMVAAPAVWYLAPERDIGQIERTSFEVFPRQIGEWRQTKREFLTADIEAVLGADEYRSATLAKDGESQPVGFFAAWYDDQSKGGVHSPEICLPGGGWEIAWLERVDIAEKIGAEGEFGLNRAIIQKGETRMMVYYYFDQKGRKIAWDFAAKFFLMVDGITTGRTDGALVRLTTLIGRDETDSDAERRLLDVLAASQDVLPRFIPLK